MHRIPIDLPLPTYFWTRTVPEYELIRPTMLCSNVNEMDLWLKQLKYHSDTYFEDSVNFANDLKENVSQIMSSQNENYLQVAIYTLHKLICRAPVHCEAYVTGLWSRAMCYVKLGQLSRAANDLEMYVYCDSKFKNPRSLFRVHGYLSFCYNMMRLNVKARHHIQECNFYKNQLSPELLEEEKEVADSIGRFVLYNVCVCEDDYFCTKSFKLQILENKCNQYIPYKGFNHNDEIPLSSSSCYYVTMGDSPLGVYTSESIPKGEIVLVEDPILFTFSTPFLHCELCFQYCDQLYTCFDCRYKTYCSVECMRADKAEHEHECIGYKYIVLLALDGTRLFRLFMRVITYLADKIFITPDLDKLTTVAEVWDYMIQAVEKELPNASAYMKFLANRPNYESLTNSQFATLISYSFRLTIFVYRMTRANEICFNKLNLPMRETMLFIGAIILRLNCHIILNSKETEFNVEKFKMPSALSKVEEENKTNKQAEESSRVNSGMYEHYKINSTTDFEKVYKRLEVNMNEKPIMLPQTEHTLECLSIQSTLTIFMDNVSETCFDVEGSDFFLFSETSDMGSTPTGTKNLVDLLTDLSCSNLSEFMAHFTRNFHYFVNEYFSQLRCRQDGPRQVVTNMCSTLLKFGHSCVPNVAIIHLNNGIILGKTLVDIEPNEELTICYKANVLQHSRSQRTAFLQYNGIICNRKCCTADIMQEPTNIRSAILCSNCNITITPLEDKCASCHTSYNQLLLGSRLFIHAIEEEIRQKSRTMSGGRELAILQGAYFEYVCKHFVEYNEFRLRAELQYAKFLAQENFSQQACDMIFIIRSHLKYYSTVSEYFNFYADILDTIKIILHNVLDYGMHTSMERSNLSKLCTLAMCILNSQETYVNFYYGNDLALAPIYRDLKLFDEWKEKIDAFVLMPEKLQKSLFKK